MTPPTHPVPSQQLALSLTSGRLPLRLELQQTMGEGASRAAWQSAAAAVVIDSSGPGAGDSATGQYA